MNTWYYKAAQSKLDQAGTVLFASRGFLARSANELKNRSSAEKVKQVQVGDTVHFYYSQKGRVSGIGAFTIVDEPKASWVREPVEGTALFKVDTAFVRGIDTQGVVEPDPVIHAFTGWLIKRIGPAAPHEATRFRGQITLVQG